jgi:hypothetical protein
MQLCLILLASLALQAFCYPKCLVSSALEAFTAPLIFQRSLILRHYSGAFHTSAIFEISTTPPDTTTALDRGQCYCSKYCRSSNSTARSKPQPHLWLQSTTSKPGQRLIVLGWHSKTQVTLFIKFVSSTELVKSTKLWPSFNSSIWVKMRPPPYEICQLDNAWSPFDLGLYIL